jgi:pilus assembly protein CpaD
MHKLKGFNNNLKQYALSIILSSLLLGCETPDRSATPMPEKPYTLQHDTKNLTLHFAGHRTKLPEDERIALVSSIKPAGPGKVSVHMTLPEKTSALGKQRLKQIIRTALKAGIKEKQIHRSDQLPSAHANSIQIQLDTYRAIPPKCPNWSTTYGSGYDRGNTSNFGCSTAVNFLLMIEDPIVLFKGEHAGNRDAARDSLAVADHRAGKDRGKWLRVEKADSGGTGSSVAGASGSGGSQQ